MNSLRILFFLLYVHASIGQNYDIKRDYIWRSGLGIQSVKATTWDFNNVPTTIDRMLKKHGNSE